VARLENFVTRNISDVKVIHGEPFSVLAYTAALATAADAGMWLKP
jgi:hypothetical protein